jgi:hypothetical protein
MFDPLSLALIGGAAAMLLLKTTVKGGGQITLKPGKHYKVRLPITKPEGDSLLAIQQTVALNISAPLGGVVPMFASLEVDKDSWWVTSTFDGPANPLTLTVPNGWAVGEL